MVCFTVLGQYCRHPLQPFRESHRIRVYHLLIIVSQGRLKIGRASPNNTLPDISLKLDVSARKEIDLPALSWYVEGYSDGFGSIHRDLVRRAPLIQGITEL